MSRTRSIAILLFFLPFAANSQMYINKSREWVKKKLERHMTTYDNLSTRLQETDSSLHLLFRGPKTQPADFIYNFDQFGKCNSEKVIAYCDSCFQKFLQAALAGKKYGWRKINGNQYISKYNARMLLETRPEKTDFSFRIIRTSWTRKLYRLSK